MNNVDKPELYHLIFEVKTNQFIIRSRDTKPAKNAMAMAQGTGAKKPTPTTQQRR